MKGVNSHVWVGGWVLISVVGSRKWGSREVTGDKGGKMRASLSQVSGECFNGETLPYSVANILSPLSTTSTPATYRCISIIRNNIRLLSLNSSYSSALLSFHKFPRSPPFFHFLHHLSIGIGVDNAGIGVGIGVGIVASFVFPSAHWILYFDL